MAKPNLNQEIYYQQFIWNYNIINLDSENFMKAKQVSKQQVVHLAGIFKHWCQTVIQGYVHALEADLPNKDSITYYLISRRSHRKAGTRFYARGLDDHGNVANFTETEQIIIYRDYAISHLQIRGSAPVFFQQKGINGLNSELVLERTLEGTRKHFVKHFQSILNQYEGGVLCVNLLSDRKTDEKKLIDFFEDLMEAEKQQLPNVKYQYFNFHEECKDNHFENSDRLVDKIHTEIANSGFTSFHLKEKRVLSQQCGIIRTNCMDSLDRTNYIQSRIAVFIL